MNETGQVYKASLDKQAKWGLKWGTYPFLFILFAVFFNFFFHHEKLDMYIGAIFCIFLSAVCTVYYLTYSIKGYILNNQNLVIKRVLSSSDIVVNISNIQYVDRFPADEFKKSRRIGQISIFGYYGDYNHPMFGYYKIYATNLSNLIMIKLVNSKNLVISPDDMGLLDALTKGIAKR